MNRIKLIVFDWDDVFTLGSSDGYYASYQKAIESVGVNADAKLLKDKVVELWGRPHKQVIASILADHSTLVDKAAEMYEKYIFSGIFISHLQLVPGSIELLNRLRKNYSLAIATGIHPKLLKEQIMPLFKIPEVFDEILTSYDLVDKSKGKPYPNLLLQILDTLHCSPEEAVMVGDASGDVRMALSAHVVPIVVLTGQLNKQEAENLGVTHVVNDVTEIESVLKQL